MLVASLPCIVKDICRPGKRTHVAIRCGIFSSCCVTRCLMLAMIGYGRGCDCCCGSIACISVFDAYSIERPSGWLCCGWALAGQDFWHDLAVVSLFMVLANASVEYIFRIIDFKLLTLVVFVCGGTCALGLDMPVVRHSCSLRHASFRLQSCQQLLMSLSILTWDWLLSCRVASLSISVLAAISWNWRSGDLFTSLTPLDHIKEFLLPAFACCWRLLLPSSASVIFPLASIGPVQCQCLSLAQTACP